MPEHKAAERARAKRLASIALLLSLALAAWGWFYPRPYVLVITLLVLWPWAAIALVVRSGGMFTLDDRRHNPQPGLGVPFIVPGLILMLRAVQDLNVVKWTEAASLAVALAVVLEFAAWKADRVLRARRISMVALALLSLSYGYGAGTEANALLDRTPAVSYSARITEKHMSRGSRSRSYRLFLEPWGPMANGDKVDVSPAFYRSLNVGDAVCLYLRPGAFRIAWYIVRRCPNSATAPTAR